MRASQTVCSSSYCAIKRWYCRSGIFPKTLFSYRLRIKASNSSILFWTECSSFLLSEDTCVFWFSHAAWSCSANSSSFSIISFVIALIALRIAVSMVEVLIKWDVQETYILRYLLHCHEESESYTTSESRCLDSGLEKLIREPQSAQNTIPARRCEYVPLGSFFGFLLRRRCALSHVSWSMIASWVFLNIILSSGVAARRFFNLKFSRILLHSTVWPRYSCRSRI